MQVGERPAALARSQLEHGAEAIRTLRVGESVNTAVGQRELVIRSAVSAGEAIDCFKGPARAGRRQPVHRTASIYPAVKSSAVEIAGPVQDHAADRILAITLALEAVQNALCPTGARARQLVHRADAESATSRSCAVKIAVSVQGHACNRIHRVGPSRETVDHRLDPSLPGTLGFEDGAIAKSAPEAGGAIDISC